MPTTFKASDVTQATERLSMGSEESIFFERCGSVKLEAKSKLKHFAFEKSGSWRPLNNAFISAVHTAFSLHYPLVLTPDSLWLVIAQGFAQHVNANSEQLRKRFVQHQGKKTVEIRPDGFVKGSRRNDWEGVLDQFSEGIRVEVGDEVHGLLTPQFSTTGAVERAAAQVVLMNCFQDYFNYRMVCICGIPEITLEGTVDDWCQLRDKAMALGQYDLQWWTGHLQPILDQFVDAASGKVDQEFWSSIYKLEQAYGRYIVNGWAVDLFPYIRTKMNEYLGCWREGKEGKLSTNAFPPGVVSAPFVWVNGTDSYQMQFYAGFMAATQDKDTLAIRPEIGWAVAEVTSVTEAKAKHERLSSRYY